MGDRKAALARVEEAIKALRDTEPELGEDADEPEFLRSWVLVAAWSSYDAEEQAGMTACSIYKPETLACHEAMGLLKAGTLLEEMAFTGVGMSPS